MRQLFLIMAALSSFAILPAYAEDAYSTSETQIGTLLDDPEARAILNKYMPGF